MKEKTREIKITPKELKIIEMMSLGYTDNEIAEKINRTASDIRNTFARLLLKTSTIHRAHLVGWAYREGILKDTQD